MFASVVSEGAENSADRFIEAFKSGTPRVIAREISRRRVKRTVNGVKGNIEEEGLFWVLFFQEAHHFGCDPICGIAFFLDGFLITVPIVDRQPCRRVVWDGVRVVVDPPAVVALLMIEPLGHR